MEYLVETVVETGSEITSDPVCKDPHIYVRTTDTRKMIAEVVSYLKKPKWDKDKLKQDQTTKTPNQATLKQK